MEDLDNDFHERDVILIGSWDAIRKSDSRAFERMQFEEFVEAEYDAPADLTAGRGVPGFFSGA